ncbi:MULTISPECIES: CpaF family protein [unclassified Mesorhizobium]|uniref:CpaF family protein n=1 Tax=unclassified Mesorhizobium TaxID=325217 RepID=UPI000BAFB502|nr:MULTISPECIES: CpaF family protein [unclassified Mesorhizobium]PBB85178.1 type II secretion system protein E [Mesorhizobium sp. WSM3876]RWB66620.1 MAG: CpaF family protein [Mesorhizobium sp.]RWB83329.1 MAG: CpaF family protein [Mesorhizobium sp.]TGS64961.1 CpaF family protein [Mesorhizobium sp. M3A.F.Ca.ET.201.01.1.1]TGS82778.1 CpaF family protein [Mesorhizobium sp. M3A.F.Ca.ET.175.01.1.1]
MLGRFIKGSNEQRSPQPAPVAVVNGAANAPAAEAESQSDDFLSLKVELHRHLIDRFNLAALENASKEEILNEIRPIVREFVRARNVPLNARELDQLTSDTADEMLGLGPIEPLLKDDSIADILINTHNHVFIERRGVLEETSIRFRDEAHLLRIVNKIVSNIGRRVDESAPMVDARLDDGSRVNIAVRPISVDGPLVSIRKFSKHPYSLERLIAFNSIRPPMVDLLRIAVQARKSILVSGGTGSGKTTLLNALSSYIPAKERLITIEDAAELQLQQPHVGRLETRPPNVEGKGEVRQRELVKNALRMRPDRIIVGEVRGEEAFDMLQAMNTGHEGSMTTIHANTPRDALSRLEQMVGMAGMPMTHESIRAQIASAIDIIVQTQRLSDGGRRVISISELTGMEGNVVQLQELYTFVRRDIAADGQIIGDFRATGIRPRFAQEAATLGLHFGKDAFNPQVPL